MFRNYLLTAVRNLARNRFYAAISILGLAVAFTVAILIALFVRNEFSYDRWLPGYQHVYKIVDVLEQPGQPPSPSDQTPSALAGQIRATFPGAAAVVRLMEYNAPLRHRPGDTGTTERAFSWVDPDVFKTFPMPVLAGDLNSALRRPDTVAITQGMARKYFGRDLPIGDTLEVQVDDVWHPMRVAAVLRDLPSNTNFTTEVFASSQSAYSFLSRMDVHPDPTKLSNYTYVRILPTQSSAELEGALTRAGGAEVAAFSRLGGGTRFSFHALPLADVHMTAPGVTAANVKPAGDKAIAFATAAVAAMIVLVAGINFVTLVTARAARRGVEVGVRKAAGARRMDLMIQFVGEALIQVGISTIVALSLAALLVKPFGAFVQRGLVLDFVHDPWLIAGVVAVALCAGLLAALYPAVVLSSFRPAVVLKGGIVQTSGSALARQTLVVAQFAVLIGLIVTAITIYQQTDFALARSMGAQNKLIVGIWTPCINAFPDEVRRLDGVNTAACSSVDAINALNSKNVTPVQIRAGQRVNFDMAPVDFGFFEVYGIRPLAGRLFSRAHGEDDVLKEPSSNAQPSVIINETALRNLGYADPRAAIGRRMLWSRPSKPGEPPITDPSEIIGVVPDMPATVRTAVAPTIYFVAPNRFSVLSVRMTGRDMPGTVRAIEHLWRTTGNSRPIQEVFLSQFRLNQYLDLIIQGFTVAICAVIAIVIACLGLFALSAYTTERRTKEIGIRKVMGASPWDVVRLLLWQFTVPVLWSIVIALPVAIFVMNRWLRGFAYHVPLSAWTFVLAAGAAVIIAWVTVTYQSYVVARAKPAGALRYE